MVNELFIKEFSEFLKSCYDKKDYKNLLFNYVMNNKVITNDDIDSYFQCESTDLDRYFFEFVISKKVSYEDYILMNRHKIIEYTLIYMSK